MNLLFRYIFLRHCRLLLLVMGLSAGIYLLTELVEKIDIFIEGGSGIGLILTYFSARLPGIVAQILPAVFLLATVISLCLMERMRELTALSSGGISFFSLAVMLVICGLFWGAVQFGCSQLLAVQGARYADSIWQEQVRKRDISQRTVSDVWFMENGWTVNVERLFLNGNGTGFSAFHMSDGSADVDVIIRAPSVKASVQGWTAGNAVTVHPESFSRKEIKQLPLPIHQDPEMFFAAASTNFQQLPLWQLGDIIDQLGSAGSNVEGLRTVWHGKIAYACSLMVMALLGAAIVSWNSNIYIAVGVSMTATFAMYSLTMFGESLGQRGSLPPYVAAWGADMLLLCLACLRLYAVSVRR